MTYLSQLEEKFIAAANPQRAIGQKAYMRDQFEYFGITAPKRKLLSKPFFLKNKLPEKHKLEGLMKSLWEEPNREYQYFGQELMQRYSKRFEVKDIILLEYMVANNSWWDTVDFIAVNLMGPYFKMFPEQINKYIHKWLASDHLWLHRSALLFQLKYKLDLNTKLLSQVIYELIPTKEFFINKAIGWVLREYTRTDKAWVIEFTKNRSLSNLSRKEALRLVS